MSGGLHVGEMDRCSLERLRLRAEAGQRVRHPEHSGPPATTMSMSWLARGSPCKLEATEPLIMYSIPAASS